MESCQRNEAICFSPLEGLGAPQKLTEEGVWPGGTIVWEKAYGTQGVGSRAQDFSEGGEGLGQEGLGLC